MTSPTRYAASIFWQDGSVDGLLEDFSSVRAAMNEATRLAYIGKSGGSPGNRIEFKKIDISPIRN